MPSLLFWSRQDVPGSLATLTSLDWPVRGKISSGFGPRGEGKDRRMHEGIDIPVPAGTLVQAALPGVVSAARIYNGYGQTVILDHEDGTQTLYAHCSELRVQEGDRVERGRIIARAGNTGRSTTAHVHFGVIVKGEFQDPEKFLRRDARQF